MQPAVMISNSLAFNILIDNFLISPIREIAHLGSDLLDLLTLCAVSEGRWLTAWSVRQAIIEIMCYFQG